jgi:hypothetical protein
MIITVKNPITNEDIDVTVEIQTNLTTYPNGMIHLQVIANGVNVIQEPQVSESEILEVTNDN